MYDLLEVWVVKVHKKTSILSCFSVPIIYAKVYIIFDLILIKRA